MGLDQLPPAGQFAMWVLAHLPGFRDVGRILRYQFSRSLADERGDDHVSRGGSL